MGIWSGAGSWLWKGAGERLLHRVDHPGLGCLKVGDSAVCPHWPFGSPLPKQSPWIWHLLWKVQKVVEVDCTLEFCWRNFTPSAVGQVNVHLYLGQVLPEEGLKGCGCFPLYSAWHKGEAPAALVPGRHCEGKSSVNFSEQHCRLIDILFCRLVSQSKAC